MCPRGPLPYHTADMTFSSCDPFSAVLDLRLDLGPDVEGEVGARRLVAPLGVEGHGGERDGEEPGLVHQEEHPLQVAHRHPRYPGVLNELGEKIVSRRVQVFIRH